MPYNFTSLWDYKILFIIKLTIILGQQGQLQEKERIEIYVTDVSQSANCIAFQILRQRINRQTNHQEKEGGEDTWNTKDWVGLNEPGK